MFHKTYFICLLLIPLYVPDVRCQSEPAQTGKLTIHMTSFLGGKLPKGQLSIYSNKRELIYSATVEDEAATRLPYGDYTVEFKSGFLQPVSRKIAIHRPDCFVVLATDMEHVVLDMPNDPVSVSIKVTSAKSCVAGGLLWAKLAGVFSDYAAERPISSGGFALFEPVEPGAYVVIIVDGQHVRVVQAVTTKGKVTVINLALPACDSTTL